jgi:hypothetical protein
VGKFLIKRIKMSGGYHPECPKCGAMMEQYISSEIESACFACGYVVKKCECPKLKCVSGL